MEHKYWLLLGLAPIAALQPAACSAEFHTCEERRNCAPGGAGGTDAGKAGETGGAGGTAGKQHPESSAGEGGADEAAGGAAGEAAGGAAGDGEGGAGGEAEQSPGNLCAPNQPTCDGNRATTCNADGTGYLAAGLKCSSKQTCLVGACEDQECSPNESFCSGNSVRQCADNGLSSAEVMMCGTSQYCDATTAKCKTGVCAPNQPACDGKRATLCTSTGDGYVAGGTACKATETCNAGECKAQVCTPSQSFCQGQTVKTCSADGLSSSVSKTCTNQTCVAAGTTAECKGVCAPGQQDCSSNGVRTCDANGQYGTASACTNKACVASGTTASCVGSCEPGEKQCIGNGIHTCNANGTWNETVACPATTPVCAANTCQAPVSCSGLAANCGTASENCCTSPLVKGGPFARNNDSNFPATVSDFKLDKYEVTVGRFRKFVDAVIGGWKPAAGSGKHVHLNGGAGLKNSGATGFEPGWDAAWSTDLLATKAEWDTNLACDPQASWTADSGGNENRPISCVSWPQATAFCIWDGGFLPSEAEANYARAGGNQQRHYPWSSPASSTTVDCSYANYKGIAGETDYCVSSGSGASSAVGAVSPKGNGFFGQADLGGNLDEWQLDWYAAYTPTCTDCANLVATNVRVISGGGFSSAASWMSTAQRDRWVPDALSGQFGFRCARTP